MTRVEVSQNVGPKVVTSIENARQPKEGKVFPTEHYRLHSYQVITDGIMPHTDVAFKIYATNDTSVGWQAIAQYNIKGSLAPHGPRHTNGILYADIWGFKYAKCKFEGSFTGAENFKVLEKHNA